MRVLGDEHPRTLSARGSLAQSYNDQGKHAEAEALQRRDVVGMQTRVLGKEHPDTLRVRDKLSPFFNNQGKHAEAAAQL